MTAINHSSCSSAIKWALAGFQENILHFDLKVSFPTKYHDDFKTRAIRNMWRPLKSVYNMKSKTFLEQGQPFIMVTAMRGARGVGAAKRTVWDTLFNTESLLLLVRFRILNAHLPPTLFESISKTTKNFLPFRAFWRLFRLPTSLNKFTRPRISRLWRPMTAHTWFMTFQSV